MMRMLLSKKLVKLEKKSKQKRDKKSNLLEEKVVFSEMFEIRTNLAGNVGLGRLKSEDYLARDMNLHVFIR